MYLTVEWGSLARLPIRFCQRKKAADERKSGSVTPALDVSMEYIGFVLVNSRPTPSFWLYHYLTPLQQLMSY